MDPGTKCHGEWILALSCKLLIELWHEICNDMSYARNSFFVNSIWDDGAHRKSPVESWKDPNVGHSAEVRNLLRFWKLDIQQPEGGRCNGRVLQGTLGHAVVGSVREDGGKV